MVKTNDFMSTRALTIILLFLFSPLSFAGVANHFWTGTKGAFTEENKWIWLGGSLLTLVAFKYDHDIYKSYAGKEKEEFPDSVGDVMGTGIPGAGIAILTMGVGWAFSSNKVFGAGQSHGEALIATFAYTSLIKLMVERDRPPAFSPNESPFNASFPSGHTSTAFATAGSIMASAGPIFGVPVLLLAGVTGYSRIQQRAHYLGDVLFGATLGYTMGTGFYKHHQGGRSIAFQIIPYFENRENFGLTARYEF